MKLDRDLNASINLERWHPDISYERTVSETGIACGGSNQLDSIAIEGSLKQEGNVKPAWMQLSWLDR